LIWQRAFGWTGGLLVALVATACATPPPPPACGRLRAHLAGLAASGGPDENLQDLAFADGLRCLQVDFDAFRRAALDAARDPRSFRLAGDYTGGWACSGEIALVIASIPHLGADSYDLDDTDGQLDVGERTRLMHVLRVGE
jgi:hypothetical protein